MNWVSSAATYIYFIFVGALYALGFWTPLHFNILEFLSPMDMIKSAIYPIIPALFVTSFFAIMDSHNAKVFQEIKKPEDDYPKSLKVHYVIVIVFALLMLTFNAVVLLSHIYHLFISKPEERLLYALPAASIIAIGYFLSRPPFLKEAKKFIRNFVVILACILPTVAYIQGHRNIAKILDGKSSHYQLKAEPADIGNPEKPKLIYLGFYGSRYMFYDLENGDIRIEDNKSLTLEYVEYKVNDSSETEENEAEGKESETAENTTIGNSNGVGSQKSNPVKE